MTDLSWALQEAIFAALMAEAAPADAAILSVVTPDQAFPFVFIGDDIATEIGPKGSRLERHEITISTSTEGESRKQLRDIQEFVHGKLHDQSIAADGATFSMPQLITSGGGQIDVSQYLGTQTFLVFVQPA